MLAKKLLTFQSPVAKDNFSPIMCGAQRTRNAPGVSSEKI
jgi:hypothetical protein